MSVWDDVIPADDLKRMTRFVSGNGVGRVCGDRPAVLVIDMSRRFTTDDYTSGDAAVAAGVIRNLQRLLERARSSRVPVIYTTTTLRRTVAQQGQWGRSTPENGAADSRGSEIHPELQPAEGEEVLWKIPPSGFLHTDMVSLLTYYQVDTVIVTGMATSGCVRATAVDAFSHNFSVIVPEECCGDRCQISHKVNLFDIHCKYGEVQPLQKTLEYLASVPPNPRKA